MHAVRKNYNIALISSSLKRLTTSLMNVYAGLHYCCPFSHYIVHQRGGRTQLSAGGKELIPNVFSRFTHKETTARAFLPSSSIQHPYITVYQSCGHTDDATSFSARGRWLIARLLAVNYSNALIISVSTRVQRKPLVRKIFVITVVGSLKTIWIHVYRRIDWTENNYCYKEGHRKASL